MAVKKPIVLTSGKIEELQSADTIFDQSPNVVSFTAGENIAKGDAVYLSAADTVSKAKADSSTTMPCIGVAEETITSGNPIYVRLSGVITSLSGLTAKNEHFVSGATAGLLTATPPSTSGYYVQSVGVAKSTSAFLVAPDYMVKLA